MKEMICAQIKSNFWHESKKLLTWKFEFVKLMHIWEDLGEAKTVPEDQCRVQRQMQSYL